MTRTVFIVGVGSGIGRDLAERYLREGFTVVGTYRTEKSVADLRNPNLHLIPCDLNNPSDIDRALVQYKNLRRPWSLFISSAGSMEPIGSFFEVDFDAWEESVGLNSLAQLRFLHGLHPFRANDALCHVVFFAGGGTNGPFRNYSAYCVSKIMLIKMCELIDDENSDLNVFIVGPGWVRTRIHEQTLGHAREAGSNYDRTLKFLRSGAPGTPAQDIYDCINWCINQGKEVSGGRNFAVVHDSWRTRGPLLAEELHSDANKFKLRRSGNED